MRQLLFAEEHVLGAAQSDAFGAERARLDGIAWNIGIGANSQRAERLGPAHELQQLGIVGRGVKGVELALDHATGGAVERNPVARFEDLPFDPHLARLFIDVDVAGAGHAALAHAARDDGSVAGHAAARSQNARRHFHAVNVFRSGFGAHQNDRILGGAVAGFLHSFVGGEDDLSDSGARRGRKSGGQHFDLGLFSSRRGTRKS